jgi:renalase
MTDVDVAVIGAGLAGLTCARQLHQAGYSVVVLEKSRGLGGRVATRRLQHTCADHGLRYLENQGDLSHTFIQSLHQAGILQVWTDQIYTPSTDGQLVANAQPHPRFVAPNGMTAIAKYWGSDITIWRSQLVTAIAPQPNGLWEVRLKPMGDEQPASVQARATVVAIPAPQAFMLLQPLEHQGLPSEMVAQLASVHFDPCLSAIATFSPEFTAQVEELPWQAVEFSHDPSLAWVGVDSRKRSTAQAPIFVIQSNAEFARRWLDATDLTAAGQHLLSRAAQVLVPWLAAPTTLQVHRWRYAIAHTPLATTYLAENLPLPLVCCGDWCGGNNLESALRSGMDAAQAIEQRLKKGT